MSTLPSAQPDEQDLIAAIEFISSQCDCAIEVGFEHDPRTYKPVALCVYNSLDARIDRVPATTAESAREIADVVTDWAKRLTELAQEIRRQYPKGGAK